MFSHCPGSSQFKQPTPEVIKCQLCSTEMEIWTDEPKAVCPKCKSTVMRREGVTCLDWCRYAKMCVGDETYNEYMQNKAVTIKQNLLGQMEACFGKDRKRINHAKNVMHFAEELLKREKGDWHIVIPAAILHDIGIKKAEEKYGSSSGKYQEKEGPQVARKMLLALGLKMEEVEEICLIIANHHSPGKVDTPNFRILYDADWLVNLKDEVDTKDKDKLKSIIDKVFLTDPGREFAKRIYLFA